MFRKHLPSIVALLAIAILGRVAGRNDSSEAIPRPLGRDFSTYQVPDESGSVKTGNS